MGPIAVEASGIAEDGHTGRAPKQVKGQERPTQELGVDFVDPLVGTATRATHGVRVANVEGRGRSGQNLDLRSAMMISLI